MVATGMSKFIPCANNDELINKLTISIVDALQKDIDQKGMALLAVSGGNSPKALFAQLKNADLKWSKVTIVLVDERWVGVDHADSNEAMVCANLLQGRAANANFIGWTSDSETLSQAVSVANDKFKTLTLPFSVIVLGMGTDGHTASWFADAPEYSQLLDSSQQPAVCAAQPSAAPHARLTLNYSAVMQTAALFLQITGMDKKHTLDRALVNTTELPIGHLIADDSPLEIYWSEA